jgi:poly(A) polymerase
MPELELMRGVEQGSMHHLDVWDHSCLVLAHTISNEHSPSRTLRWAALLHDVAKPNTQTFDEQGSIRFFGHDVVGAAMSFEILARLRFSQSDSEGISQLVRQHMRLGSTARWSDAALRRLIRDLGDQLEDLFALTEADSNALAPGVKTLDLDVIRRGLDDLRARETVSRYESPLRGEQIMAILDIPPGPKVGYWKQRLLTAVLDGVLAPGDADAATRFLLSENTGCG